MHSYLSLLQGKAYERLGTSIISLTNTLRDHMSEKEKQKGKTKLDGKKKGGKKKKEKESSTNK